MAEGKVNCLHFLIKNTDSRNPVSRRTGQEITLTKAEAAKELAQFRDELKKAPDAKTLEKMFRAVTVKRSDCGSFRTGGELGSFSFGDMVPAFSKAAFALKVGQMSDIVDSDSGLHLILRIA